MLRRSACVDWMVGVVVSCVYFTEMIMDGNFSCEGHEECSMTSLRRYHQNDGRLKTEVLGIFAGWPWQLNPLSRLWVGTSRRVDVFSIGQTSPLRLVLHTLLAI